MQKNRKSVFPGGVHPTDGSDKVLSMDAAVRQYWPDTVTILSEQSFGKCRLLVKAGDTVEEGQLIGEPEAFMAAPLHASVSGRSGGQNNNSMTASGQTGGGRTR